MSISTGKFAMPTYGDPNAMFSLSNNLVEKAETLVAQLTALSAYNPVQVTFPQLTFNTPPVPVEPPAPNLINVAWKTPSDPADFTQLPPDIHGLFPASFSVPPPVLNFGTAPQPTFGSVPASPPINFNYTYPNPTITLPTPPQLLTLDVVDFNPFDIPDFTGTVPTFNLVAPTPLNWTEGWTYTSSMLTTIQDELTDALTNDSNIGLSASTQQAMWDAAYEREYRAQANALADLERLESMNFNLPSGVYLDARLKVQTETQYTTAGLSRDIMVKQAELRLENVTKARELAISLEGQLIQYANNVQQRAFEAARYQTEAMIQIFNAQVQAFTARIEGFKASIQVFDATIRAIEARIEQIKAQIAFEQTKAQINETLVQTYKTQLDAALSTLEVAKVQVEIIQTQASIEKAKIETYGAQVNAFVATVNAFTAQVEGYKANVEAQAAIEGVFKTQVEAYTAEVQAGAAQAQALVAGFDAQVKGYEARLEAFKAQLQAMVEQARAASEYNIAITEEYKAEIQANAAYNEVLVKEWQAVITEEIQIADMITKVAEVNAQLQLSQRQITEEAIKGAAQIMSQLGAAALGAIHWGNNVNWSESNSWSIATSFSQSTSDDHIYSQSV